MADALNLAPGTPIWVDLASPDIDASKTFYGKLFGWEAFTVPDPEAGGYTMWSLQGKTVAAVGPIFNPQQPPAWSMYVATTDAGATARAVREAGGQVVVEPIDVMQAGRMAVFMDPAGAFFSVWQRGETRGAELVNDIGAFSWNELNTRDIDAAKPFYKAVFGWDSATNPMPNGGSYTTWKVDGRDVAGGFEMTDQIPANVPPHWLTYFSVANCDSAVTQVQELGGTVLVPPMDIDIGHFAVVTDPQGAAFAVFQAKS